MYMGSSEVAGVIYVLLLCLAWSSDYQYRSTNTLHPGGNRTFYLLRSFFFSPACGGRQHTPTTSYISRIQQYTPFYPSLSVSHDRHTSRTAITPRLPYNLLKRGLIGHREGSAGRRVGSSSATKMDKRVRVAAVLAGLASVAVAQSGVGSSGDMVSTGWTMMRGDGSG